MREYIEHLSLFKSIKKIMLFLYLIEANGTNRLYVILNCFMSA